MSSSIFDTASSMVKSQFYSFFDHSDQSVDPNPSDQPIDKDEIPLKERVTIHIEEMPFVFAIAASVLGLVLSLIWGYNTYAVVFSVGTICSIYGLYEAHNHLAFEKVNTKLKGEVSNLAKENVEYKGLNSEHDKLNKSFRETQGELEVTKSVLATTADKLDATEKQLQQLGEALRGLLDTNRGALDERLKTFSTHLGALGVAEGSLSEIVTSFNTLLLTDKDLRNRIGEVCTEIGQYSGKLELVKEQFSSVLKRQEEHAANLKDLGALFTEKMLIILTKAKALTGVNEVQIKEEGENFAKEVAAVFLHDNEKRLVDSPTS